MSNVHLFHGRLSILTKITRFLSSAIVLNFKLDSSPFAPTYYYAKRGCTTDPDDGIISGMAEKPDDYIVPIGYTGIKQYNQRTTVRLGNDYQTEDVFTAQEFKCFACQSTITVKHVAQPSYSDIFKTQDFCWETFPQQVIISRILRINHNAACS